MAIESNECQLSPEAAKTRRKYYREWRAKNRGADKAIKFRYWEKKAQEYYGADYVGPLPGEELSRQARDVRRKYYAEYRKKNQTNINKTYSNYWERKVYEKES